MSWWTFQPVYPTRWTAGLPAALQGESAQPTHFCCSNWCLIVGVFLICDMKSTHLSILSRVKVRTRLYEIQSGFRICWITCFATGNSLSWGLMRVESAHPPSLNGAGMVYLLSKKEATEMERLPSLTNESINQYHRGRKMKPCYIHTFPFADPHRTGQIFDIVCVCVHESSL